MDDEEKKTLLRLYFFNGNSPTLTLRAYQKEKCVSRPLCDESAIRRLVKKFEECGTVCDRRAGSGRLPVSEEDIQIVNEVRKEMMSLNDYGMCSVRQIASDRRVSVCKTTVHKILRELDLKPYRPHVVQQLFPQDKVSRLQFADKAKEMFDDDFSNVFWTDEAIFSLYPQISSLNGSIWSEENPYTRLEKSLYPQKLMVWVGLSANFVCKPFFFDGSVNSHSYLEMLQSHCLPFLRRKRVTRSIYFQQDGAPLHVGCIVKQCLQENFAGRVISRHFEFSYPPHSPDVTPLDFWFWGVH